MTDKVVINIPSEVVENTYIVSWAATKPVTQFVVTAKHGTVVFPSKENPDTVTALALMYIQRDLLNGEEGYQISVTKARLLSEYYMDSLVSGLYKGQL